MDRSLRFAIERAGGVRALARALGIHHQSVRQWKRIPPARVGDVARATGIAREKLRPDLAQLFNRRAP